MTAHYEPSYYLVYRSEGIAIRGRGNPTTFKYRIWLGKDVEPVCLVSVNKAEDAHPANRLAIQRAILKMSKTKSVRYFECVMESKRIITEVYFAHAGKPLCIPRGEERSLSYLEFILGRKVGAV